jgi:hypothetical protein
MSEFSRPSGCLACSAGSGAEVPSSTEYGVGPSVGSANGALNVNQPRESYPTVSDLVCRMILVLVDVFGISVLVIRSVLVPRTLRVAVFVF